MASPLIDSLVVADAIAANSVEDTRMLLESQFDFNKPIPQPYSVEGQTIYPISLACANGCVDVLKFLLDNNVDANIPGNDGKLPIHYTCDAEGRADEKKVECVVALNALIQANCDINVVDNMGRTPLFLACEADNVEAVKLLIDNHCDVNKQTVCGDSALKVSCRNAKYWSYWHGRDSTCSSTGRKKNPYNFPPIQITMMLLEANANTEATLLPTAVQLGNSKIVEELLDLGMDINMLDDNMCTPIGIACSSTHVSPNLVKLLLDRGADVNKGGGWKKQKPLIFAYVHNSVEKIKLLISYGAKLSSGEMTEMVSLTLSKSILENPEVIGPNSKELLSWRLLMAQGFTPVVNGTDLSNKFSQLSICSSHDKISPWLKNLLYPVRSLKELCRISIRNSTQIPVDLNLDYLPLPESVKDFLKVNEIGLTD
ncbi:serine/threonine-protein phosphatase 6 regulatory ankyrin repeat subunit A-like [Mya arenaria]|nr:serine/threonine-protein phosphatase 6 regulatory ankyrin repeat subunit A-like [Mya arenaria]XP_052796149.1 serine/threonine-protein phosphatase 6 regulatory ankyrin repeat subunit A-like [Mya arenaria]